MRISKEKAADNKDRVLRAARDLFSAHGLEGVGVAEIMRAAGLTHGGFYNHFQSKEHLHASACAFAFDSSIRRIERLVARTRETGDRAPLRDFIDSYLSPQARDDSAIRCAVAAFEVDVAQSGPAARKAFAAGAARFFAALAPLLGEGEPAHARALAFMSAMIGALRLARSLRDGDPALSDAILAAARDRLKATFAAD